MNLSVLIATMNQAKGDHSLLRAMNIQSDVIVGNQCDRNEVEEFLYEGHHAKYLSFNEKGVGLNRNNALMRSKADISVIADDDLVFVDGYSQIIRDQFAQNPHADVIIFNLHEENGGRKLIGKKHRVNYWNFMRYGAARISVRTKSITRRGITFNLHFGGGTEHSAGEDTLFLADCLKRKLCIIAVPIIIAKLTKKRKSTWFEGYTDKYFKDKGIVFYHISNRWAKLLCLQFAIRRRKIFQDEKSALEAFRLMREGVRAEAALR